MNEFQALHERLEKVIEGLSPDKIQEFEELMWQIKELADQAYEITEEADSDMVSK